MTEQRLYTVRPTSKPARTDYKDILRVYFTPATLLFHKFIAGDVCLLKKYGEDGQGFAAITFPTSDRNVQSTIVQMSKAFQEMHGIKLGDQLMVDRAANKIEDAVTLEVTQLTGQKPKIATEAVAQDKEHLWWTFALAYPLLKAELICVGMIFEEVIAPDGEKRAFKIEKVNQSSSGTAIYRCTKSSSVTWATEANEDGVISEQLNQSFQISGEKIGGLRRELERINEILKQYNPKADQHDYISPIHARRDGLLLHGPSGTGKTMLLKEVSKAGWRRVLEIDLLELVERGSAGAKKEISKVFLSAYEAQPSLLLIDELDLLAGDSRTQVSSSVQAIISSLTKEMDNLGSSRILVLAAAANMRNMNSKLRRPGIFGQTIYIPVPDSKARAEMLKIFNKIPKDQIDGVFDALGDRTHAFVGRDLEQLCQAATKKAESRWEGVSRPLKLPSNDDGLDFKEENPSTPGNLASRVIIVPTEADYNAVLDERSVVASAMQEVFLETPKVRWKDIGGQVNVKEALVEAVELPIKHASVLREYGETSGKGLLLYGPPGCSKTLVAKAVATEAGVNFLAVKGAEMLSMYVGESESNLREIFQKARAASPSIIFFDEIDAIGSSRESGGAATSQSGLNVLTTLLNELDGIEELKGVFVLAATNKPWALDPALVRPGRLDQLLYVGLPDEEARAEIFRIQSRTRYLAIAQKDEVDSEDGAAELDWLVNETEGFSGAELTKLCKSANLAAIRERIATGIKRPAGRLHFEKALQEIEKGITKEMVEDFENWKRSRKMY